jgi:hypothetical protein
MLLQTMAMSASEALARGSKALERQDGVLKLRLFASEILLLPNQALQDGKVFGAGIHGEPDYRDHGSAVSPVSGIYSRVRRL